MLTVICTSCQHPVHARASATFGVPQCTCRGVRKQTVVKLGLPVVVAGCNVGTFMLAAADAVRKTVAAAS